MSAAPFPPFAKCAKSGAPTAVVVSTKTKSGAPGSPAPSGQSPCQPASGASFASTWTNILSNNQVGGTNSAPGGLGYDAAGNVTNDGINIYLYDAEGRLCAVQNQSLPGKPMTGYIYNAAGERVGKGSITTMSCDPSTNGFKPVADYVIGPGGEQLTEMDYNGSTMVWAHTNVYAGGHPMATYDSSGLHFHLTDWLGTRRAQTNYIGALEMTCTSLPYGDNLSCSGPARDATEHHFTGKERDAESGLDNFPARYFTSNMGRWMTPDIMGGHVADPQTLNKYAYARNNPVSLTDPTGLDSYLQCTPTKDNTSTCQQQRVGGTDKNPQMAWVQGVSGKDGFTATRIGNDPNGSGNLVDLTTGTGTYTGSVNGSGVQFSNNGGETSSTGVFVNGTPQNTFQDAGWANGNALSGFTFTLTNSKMEAGQTEAGTFFGIGNKDQVERAIEAAGFKYHFLGFDRHFDEYRSPGDRTGANSGHFNVSELHQNPKVGVPITPGNMHFGEHNPFSGLGAAWEHTKEQQ